MKIMLDKNTEVEFSYTSLNFGKIVLDIPSDQAESVVKAIVEEIGFEPIQQNINPQEDIESIMECFNFEDVMNYYGVSAVCEWCEANR